MKQILQNIWFRRAALISTGFLLGLYVGGEGILRYTRSLQVRYAKALEDYYVGGRIFALFTSMMIIRKAESGKIDGLIADGRVMLRGSFQSLAELHKSGQYPKQDVEMRRVLIQAKRFIDSRPAEFADVEYIKPPEGENLEWRSRLANFWIRRNLTEALDYVATLSDPGINKTNSIEPPRPAEPSSAGAPEGR